MPGVVLFNVEDPIQDAGGEAETDKVQDFVVHRKRVRNVCEPEKCEDQHDDASEEKKPLANGYLSEVETASTRTYRAKTDGQGLVFLNPDSMGLHDSLCHLAWS